MESLQHAWSSLTQNSGPRNANAGVQQPAAASSLSPSSMSTVLLVAGAVAVLLLVVLLVVRLRRGSGGVSTLTRSVVNLAKRPVLLSSSAAPPTQDGQEYSYGFWLYLNGIEHSDAYPLVFLRSPKLADQVSDPNAVLGSSGPVVFLDKSTNKLYISLPTTNTPNTVSMEDLAKDPATIVIDYVSLQEWVFVAFAVKDASVAVYMHGDLYTRFTLSDSPSRPIFRGTKGGFQLSSTSDRPKCLLSKLQAFSKSLTPREVKALYRQGPNGGSSLLTKLGLPSYNFRWPVYNAAASTCGTKKH